MAGLLNWSWPSGGGITSELYTSGLFGEGVTETLDQVLESYFMTAQDTCCDPTGSNFDHYSP